MLRCAKVGASLLSDDIGLACPLVPEVASVAKDDLLEMEGRVIEVQRDTRFLVRLENGMEVAAYASGKMRKHRIRILAGDRVTLEMSPYDLSKARITYRHKD